MLLYEEDEQEEVVSGAMRNITQCIENDSDHYTCYLTKSAEPDMKKAGVSCLFVLTLLGAHGQQCQNDSTGLIPIMDLGTLLFNGMQGGLYGNGQNTMPPQHLLGGIHAASQVLPLSPQGQYDPNGRIGFISLGMSNGNLFFAGLRDSASAFPGFNSRITMVNGATGGYDIDAFLDTLSPYWTTLDQKMTASGISNEQVQVVWFMQAKHITGIPPNEGIQHIGIMEAKFLQAFQYFRQRFPNLRQIYCSGRDYGGYSQPNSGNPEPYSYYTNWAFRKLVERQINLDTLLAYTGPNPKTAWLGWSHYVWADGKNLRSDGFNWLCPDDVQSDGVHPNANGKAKVTGLLMHFFKTDTTAYWFRDNSHVGIEKEADSKKSIQLKICPNPAIDHVEIDLGGIESTRLQIIDIAGKIIEEPGNGVIDISGYPPGLYLVRVIHLDGFVDGKFVKQ